MFSSAATFNTIMIVFKVRSIEKIILQKIISVDFLIKEDKNESKQNEPSKRRY